jgi:hypothetical protein
VTREPDPGGDTPPHDAERAARAPRRRSRRGVASRGWRRQLGLTLAGFGLAAVIAVNVVVMEGTPPSSDAPPAPSGSASAPLPASVPEHAEARVPDDASAPPDGAVAEADGAAPDDADEAPAPEEPPPAKPDKRGAGGTVERVAARSCSTAGVDGLSRQIIAEARCVDANAFTRVPSRRNLATSGHVFLYLDAPARDHLVRVLDAHPDRVMKVNSALRTVAQQYLLSRWAAGKRCGIQLATRPGESNHETGLALDLGGHAAWRSALELEGFKWLGSIDRVHFDFAGPGAMHHAGLDVLAFQRLWNRNHPDDTIPESRRYDAQTEIRLKKAPAAGFPIGARCGRGQDGAIAGGGSARARAH